MKTSQRSSFWTKFYCIKITAQLCFAAVIKSLFNKPSRSWINRSLNRWCDKLLTALQLNVRCYNPHNIVLANDRPYIIMCNHTSLFDIPLSFHAFPKQSIRMLAKKELSYLPLMGRAMKKTDFPFIDRKNREQAIKDLEYAKNIMHSGVALWIAPEGTRSKNGKLKPFKKGGFITAIQSGAQIVPLGIKHAHQILPEGKRNINFNCDIELHIGQPIDSTQFKIDEKEQLLLVVEDKIRELSGQKSKK